MTEVNEPLSVIVVGASGDLARKKIMPALFALFSQGFLPCGLRIYGYARSEYSDEGFRDLIKEHLTCRYVPDHACDEQMDEFLSRCHYVRGGYDSVDGFLGLYSKMQETGHGQPVNRLFYLAIPPSVFVDVARAIGSAGLVSCGSRSPWTRVVIEKPFGRDRDSSDKLTRELSSVFAEQDTYRIDHYLGKEVIQNLLVLRFANMIFEPVWNRNYVESVQICWQEDIGTAGRGGYFDSYGIIRDVIQNHLMQIMALTAMEPPESLTAHSIRDEKVKLLRAVKPLSSDDLITGQYSGRTRNGIVINGYRDDETVNPDSKTPTFAAAFLNIDNDRWHGVPFLVYAGKAMKSKTNEIRIKFKPVASDMFCSSDYCPEPNVLTIKVQPGESINFKITNKVPGMGMKMESRDLNLRYDTAFDQLIPDAYENLLLDVMKGEKSLFIRKDELEAAWDIFTPILHSTESRQPFSYEFGTMGPKEMADFAALHGMDWTE